MSLLSQTEFIATKKPVPLAISGVIILCIGLLMLRNDLSKEKFNFWDYIFSYKNNSFKLILFGLILLILAII